MSNPCYVHVSYPMLRMTHPSRNFFVLSLFSLCSLFVLSLFSLCSLFVLSLFSLCSVFLCMFGRLRVQGFESSVNKVFQKEKLVNSKTIIYSPQLKGLVQQELT
jgi:hypothetical protein